MKKVVLVTGASGYLGGRLCHALIKQGNYTVRAFIRSTSDISSLPPPVNAAGGGSLELSYGDVTDYPSLLQASVGCHVIFHAAAVVDPWVPHPSTIFKISLVGTSGVGGFLELAYGDVTDYRSLLKAYSGCHIIFHAAAVVEVNVGGLENVLQVYTETKTIEKIIYTSSFFALGSTDGYTADENQMHHGKFFCTEYEKSKVLTDKIALEAASKGVPIIPVYPGVIYGAGKFTSGNSVARLIIEHFSGRLPGYIGNGNDKFSFSHVDDVADGHISALEKGRPGERYLLTGENASFKDIFDIAAAITGRKKPWFSIPLFLIEVFGWISVFVARITGKLPIVCPPTVCVIRHQWAYTCEKAERELGYNSRSLREGLSEVLPWLKSLKLINY